MTNILIQILIKFYTFLTKTGAQNLWNPRLFSQEQFFLRKPNPQVAKKRPGGVFMGQS